MNKTDKFFEDNGNDYIVIRTFYDANCEVKFTIEDIYQHFKNRLVKEMAEATEAKALGTEILFSRSIDDFEFSIRVRNVLRDWGVKTLGDLITYSRDDLLRMRHLGARNIKEIVKELESLGLELSKTSRLNLVHGNGKGD